MSRDRVEELLQECLSAYEKGLTPEECLAVFPAERDVLEPLFRQALSLRFAYAAAPSEEFRNRTREKLMFAAGREVKQAYAATPRPEFRERAREKLMFSAGRDVSRAYANEPDPRFVASTRRRLIGRAGADAQESLRAVPPPRLAFWINARRRLLEAAAMSPRPAVQPMTLALRRSLSAAVVVLAVAVAGLAYITAQTRPQSVGAEVAQLEVQWQEVQEQLASGQPVATNVIVELTTRSTALAGKLSNDSAAPAPVAEKLGAIIDSQQVVVNEVATAASPELQQVQEQLNQAEEKVRIVAAAASPIAQPSTTAASPTTAPSSTSTPRSTATARPGPTATPLPLQPRQVSIRLDPSDTTYGMSWTAVRTANMSFAIPTSWEITNLVVNANGIANLDSNFIFISGEEANVIVNTQNAEILATIDGGPRVVLRTEGKNGKLIELEALVEQAEEVALELRHLLTSLKLTGSLAD